MASIADEITRPAGTVPTHEGERGREFLVLFDGKVEVRRKGRKVATIRPGDFLGEVALVSDRPRVATITATTQVRVLVIRDTEFRSVLLRAPQIALRLLAAFADRLPPGTT